MSLIPSNLRHEFLLAPNPGVIRVNEVTLAMANMDTIKELTQSMVVKQEGVNRSKIELAYEQVLS